jgi:hypothetical protein
MSEHEAAQQQSPQESLACVKSYRMSTSLIIVNAHLPHDGLTIFLRKGTLIHWDAQLCASLLIFYDVISMSVLNYVRDYPTFIETGDADLAM